MISGSTFGECCDRLMGWPHVKHCILEHGSTMHLHYVWDCLQRYPNRLKQEVNGDPDYEKIWALAVAWKLAQGD